jgi:hypothetical protein
MDPQASRWKYSLRPVQLDEFGPVPEFLFCRPFVVLQVCAALGGGIGLIVVMVGLIVAVALPERLVNPCDWDCVLWEGDASLTDFAWPCLEIGSPHDEGAADGNTPPANGR